MDYNSSYKGLILVIQKSNIKFLDTSIISMGDTSPIFPFFLNENQFQNLDSM